MKLRPTVSPNLEFVYNYLCHSLISDINTWFVLDLLGNGAADDMFTLCEALHAVSFSTPWTERGIAPEAFGITVRSPHNPWSFLGLSVAFPGYCRPPLDLVPCPGLSRFLYTYITYVHTPPLTIEKVCACRCRFRTLSCTSEGMEMESTSNRMNVLYNKQKNYRYFLGRKI